MEFEESRLDYFAQKMADEAIPFLSDYEEKASEVKEFYTDLLVNLGVTYDEILTTLGQKRLINQFRDQLDFGLAEENRAREKAHQKYKGKPQPQVSKNTMKKYVKDLTNRQKAEIYRRALEDTSDHYFWTGQDEPEAFIYEMDQQPYEEEESLPGRINDILMEYLVKVAADENKRYTEEFDRLYELSY